jgi:hypothetical protein
MIAADQRRWDDIPLLPTIFATSEPAQIAHFIDDFCRTHLSSAPIKTEFFAPSVGAVFGLCLSDGRRVVVKAHSSSHEAEFLRAVSQVQRYLVDQGYPCPRPILGPLPLCLGLATVEELVDEGAYGEPHDPAICRSLADLLVQLVNLLRNPSAIPGIQAAVFDQHPLPPGVLWSVPHNAIFDFAATATGAEWIDDLARPASETLASGAGELVLGHTDWSVKHVRYVAGKARVIYDWDSLARMKEPAMVGSAAMNFTYNEWGAPARPTCDEARAFVSAYETARGASFTPEEYRTLQASVTYRLAYGSRCEHSLNPTQTVYPADSCRALLACYGENFL